MCAAGRPEPDGCGILVVGAGPAGSTVAGLLADMGWDVLVLDRHRFPRPKACGECLNPGAVGALRRLGLLEAVRTLRPSPIRGWDLFTAGGVRVEGRFGPDVEDGLALPRARLDMTLLAEARRRGARIREGFRVTGVEPARPDRGPRVEAVGPDGRHLQFRPRLVIGADGLRSVVARAVGGVRRRPRLRKASLTFRVRGGGLPPDRGRLHLSGEGTVGIAPVGSVRTGDPGGRPTPRPETDPRERRWNVTVVSPSGEAARVLGGGPSDVLARALARAAPDWQGEATLEAGPWGSGPFDWPARPFPAPGVVLVGDAAGYFDPLTGQGLYRALRSAEIVARAIDRTSRRGRVSWASLATGGRRLENAFRPGRDVQKVVEAVVSSRRLREPVLRRLAAAPGVLDALIRVTGDARRVRSLLAPALWTRLLAPGRNP